MPMAWDVIAIIDVAVFPAGVTRRAVPPYSVSFV
jgi:hypothetical protein